MRTLLAGLAGAAGLAGWWIESRSGARLEAELSDARRTAREVEELQRETERLRRKPPDEAELKSPQANASANTSGAQVDKLSPAADASARLPSGIWRAAAEWKNRGDATPHATVETALWAAAGGDIGTLESCLVLDAETRAKADALLAGLPQTTRGAYPTVDRLIAAFTVQSIPVGEAQLVWQQEHADTATIGVLLRNPPQPDGAAVFREGQPQVAGPADKVPPTQQADRRSGMVFLQLRRIDDRWKLVVPESALKKISADLGRGR
ncbi:MAG TPA: hypothetical protein VM029_06090 [Opitutaceae bacterium]|nr:hypothetical protein [Opitutaceae bacterium]